MTDNPIFAVAAKAEALRARGTDVITLASGEPQAATSAVVVEAAVTAVRDPAAHDRGWTSSADLAAWLLDTAQLAVVPGEAFNAPGRIRVCFAVDDDTLITAIERLRTTLGPAEYEPAVQKLEEAR
jgi:aspartate/methionine/tyrosine aminotransferase